MSVNVQQEYEENGQMVVVRLVKLRWLHVDFISIFIKGLSSYGHQRPTTNHYCFYGHSKLPTIKHTCDANILYFLIYRRYIQGIMIKCTAREPFRDNISFTYTRILFI